MLAKNCPEAVLTYGELLMPKKQAFDISWKVGGEAGQGVLTTGFVIGKAFSLSGYNVFTAMENPSLIRGGHNTMQVRITDLEEFCLSPKTDILIALNRESLFLHADEIKKGGFIIYDSGKVELTPEERNSISKKAKIIGVPFTQICMENKYPAVMINTIAAGASIACTNLPMDFLDFAIEKNFQSKNKDSAIIESNKTAAKIGYQHVHDNYAEIVSEETLDVPQVYNDANAFFNGSEAFAIGALKAGCKFVAEYPMTPSTEFLTFMAAHEKDYDIVTKQTEDEISALGHVIGASYAGARAMTATSGGGFSLMVEYLGLAGMTEVPCVIINAQRPGPSTGLPTWTEQGDLRFAIHASQGEFPRIVMAPGDLEDCFYLAGDAFNLADQLQSPVIVLFDKVLAESKQTIAPQLLDESKIVIDRGKLITEEGEKTTAFYARYALTEDGISPRPLPGSNYVFSQASDEHDELGKFEEGLVNRKKMMEKRMQKLETIAKELPAPKYYGDKKAKLVIVGFGSTKTPILETLEKAEREGKKVGYIQIVYLNPFPTKQLKKMLEGKKLMVVESNYTGQLESLIRENCLIEADANFRKYDGRPIDAFELSDAVFKVLKKL